MTITDPTITDPTEWLLGLDRKVAVTDLTDDLVAAATEYLAAYTGTFEFLTHLKAKVGGRNGKPLTPEQAKGVLNCWRAAALRAAEPKGTTPVPTGTATIVGVIFGIKIFYGTYGDQWKMRVLDDRGFIVWGTLPRAIDHARLGDRVTFTATITASDTDPTFGFFKRPRNAILPDRPRTPDGDPSGDDDEVWI